MYSSFACMLVIRDLHTIGYIHLFEAHFPTSEVFNSFTSEIFQDKVDIWKKYMNGIMIMSGRTKEQDKTTSLVCWLMDFKQRDELKYGLLTTMLLFLNLKHRRKSMLDGRFVLSLGRKNKIQNGQKNTGITWRFFF